MPDNHFGDVAPGSKSLTPLVGTCQRCGRECCNCKQCVLAKGKLFNLCAKCCRESLATPVHSGTEEGE